MSLNDSPTPSIGIRYPRQITAFGLRMFSNIVPKTDVYALIQLIIRCENNLLRAQKEDSSED